MDCAIDYAGKRIAFGDTLIKMPAVQVQMLLLRSYKYHFINNICIN